jgi:hypothetical protein
MRDTEHLKALPQVLKPRPDDIGDTSTNASVHLVENERPWSERVRIEHRTSLRVGQRFQRQHDPRQLAARHDPREGPKFLTGIWRHEKFGTVDAALSPSRLGKFAVVESHLETRSGHCQFVQQSFHFACEMDRGRAPSSRQLSCLRQILRGRGLDRFQKIIGTLADSPKQVALARQHGATLDDIVEGRSVFALQPLEQREPVLHLLQASRRCVDAVGVASKKERQILELRFDPITRFDIRRKLRIDRGELSNALPDTAEFSEYRIVTVI